MLCLLVTKVVVCLAGLVVLKFHCAMEKEPW